MKKLWDDLLSEIHGLSVKNKVYSTVALFSVLIILLLTISVQSVRLQAEFREKIAASAASALYVERANALIYAIVMESRGIYMSTDREKVKLYGDALLKRNKELASVVTEWQRTVRGDDAGTFSTFKTRIDQFSNFRNELVRRAVEIDPSAGRQLGDNDGQSSVRIALNNDLEALARIYAERAKRVEQLGEQSRLASWYLIILGIGVLTLAAIVSLVIRSYVIGPLSEITAVTSRIAAGKIKLSIPHVKRKDEIGRLARAVQNFQDTIFRNLELQELELATARERDALAEQRDSLDDRYHAKKWQLDAAINNMPQGLIMLDSTANVMVVNTRFREMYGLPREMARAGCSLKEILRHRAENGLFSGDIEEYLARILTRIAKRKPTVNDFELEDGRVVRVSEQPMAGGGWVATHEDFTEQRRVQRILERTERLLATVIENIPEAIVAKDSRDLRYIFVNRAAEKLYGISRADIIGKTARQLFPPDTAELIERHDRQLLEENREIEVTAQMIVTPGNGRRLVTARRLPIVDQDGDSRFLLSLIQDRTDHAQLAA
jgi:PAS domain S-box-containing protein